MCHRICVLVGILVCMLPEMVFGQKEEEAAVNEELENIKAIVDGLNESAIEYRNYVDALRKIKISGYLQTQWRLTDLDGTAAQFSGGNFPANVKNQLQVRRGRVKVAYDNVLTQFVTEVDIVPTGLSLRDAYLMVTEPWMQSFGLQSGVFYRPFGYETSFSSGVRESPEQSRMFQTLLPGERDLGAVVFFAPQLGSLNFLRADIGVFNGAGVNANEFDNFKDFIGRVTVQLPFDEIGAALDLGVSGYFGNVRNNTKYLWTSGEISPGIKGFVVDSSLVNQSAGVARKYVGMEAQFYYDVPLLGGMALRAELITGVQPGTSDSVRNGTSSTSPISPQGKSLTTVSPAVQTLGPVYKRNFLGWYLNLVQNIGNRDQVIIKYDVYDPNTDVSAGDFSAQGNLSPADIKYSTLGIGVIHHWDETVKFLVYYEFVKNERLNASAVAAKSSLVPFASDLRDNVFTFRVQYRF
jgi:hypothetical protein